MRAQGKVWFTADLHVGHRLVAGHRGFTDDDTAVASYYHDRTVADRWDAAVGHGDHVWVLGDLSAGGSAAQRRALDWVDARPGIKHLVSGNHDGVFPQHRDAHKHLPSYLDVFASVTHAARRRLTGTEVLLSHLPYAGDRGVDRYPQWRLKDLGVPLLHGHTHAAEKVSRTEAGTLQICVGLDAWGLAPAALGDIDRLIQQETA